MGTLKNWDIFSDKEHQDSLTALLTLANNYHFTCFTEEDSFNKIMNLMDSNQQLSVLPVACKIGVIDSVVAMLKNFQFKKTYILTLLNFPSSHLKILATLILQSLQIIQEEIDSQTKGSEEQEESTESKKIQEREQLISSCLQVMIRILCVTQRKFYIPGETLDNHKLR